jgi:Domain of unknown function (DUF5916)/Carbohydrate family 9 binding domain-like
MLSLALALVVAASPSPADSTFQITVAPTADAPEIDGVVGDGEWAGAGRAAGFIQYEPRRGAAGTERTEVLVLQDAEALYVAFRVWDSGEPTAQLTRRDAELTSDDAVGIVLDTYRDRQSAYLFMTNLLGTQQDGRIAEDGRTVDYAWDAEWETAAARTEWGWTTEFAIPFSSLRYESGEDRVWGVNFGRTLRRSLEMDFWAGPLDQALRVSQAGDLTGLDLPRPPRPADVIVYGLTRAADGQDTRWDGGADLRFAPDPSVAINGTVNPDFATIEADREQVNLSRFELSLPEKRPFFLEGNELFRQRIRSFYTRRISDIRGGGRVIGKKGAWTYAGMAVSGEALEGAGSPFYSVGRVRRDLGRSNVGLTWAERRLDGEGRGSVGMDATLFFSSTLGFTGQALQSYGPFSDGATAFFLRPSYDSPTGHFHVRYTDLGDRFADNVNAIGFIRDDDRREIDSAVEKTVWIESGPLERFSYDSNYNIYWGQDGTRRSWQIDQGVGFQFRNRWALDLSYNEEFKLFEKEFRNRATSVELGYNTREFTSASTEVEFGRSFDSDFVLVSGNARMKPTPQSALEYSIEWLSLDPDPERESTWIHVVRGSQFFTNDLFVQFFLQSNSAIDRREAQVVFVYRYRPPFGTIQLAFQRGRAEFGERSQQGNTVFLKGTWVF